MPSALSKATGQKNIPGAFLLEAMLAALLNVIAIAMIVGMISIVAVVVNSVVTGAKSIVPALNNPGEIHAIGSGLEHTNFIQ